MSRRWDPGHDRSNRDGASRSRCREPRLRAPGRQAPVPASRRTGSAWSQVGMRPVAPGEPARAARAPDPSAGPSRTGSSTASCPGWSSAPACCELASDDRIPLLERVKFLAIFSEGLDEFFQVRVAGLEDQVAAGLRTRSPDGLSPRQQLDAITGRADELVDRQSRDLRRPGGPGPRGRRHGHVRLAHPRPRRPRLPRSTCSTGRSSPSSPRWPSTRAIPSPTSPASPSTWWCGWGTRPPARSGSPG